MDYRLQTKRMNLPKCNYQNNQLFSWHYTSHAKKNVPHCENLNITKILNQYFLVHKKNVLSWKNSLNIYKTYFFIFLFLTVSNDINNNNKNKRKKNHNGGKQNLCLSQIPIWKTKWISLEISFCNLSRAFLCPTVFLMR